MKKLLILTNLVLLSGCATSRGFLTGVVGGPLAVDEYVHNEANNQSPSLAIKVGVHEATLISTTLVLWPFAAAYGMASGIYGAYQFTVNQK